MSDEPSIENPNRAYVYLPIILEVDDMDDMLNPAKVENGL